MSGSDHVACEYLLQTGLCHANSLGVCMLFNFVSVFLLLTTTYVYIFFIHATSFIHLVNKDVYKFQSTC